MKTPLSRRVDRIIALMNARDTIQDEIYFKLESLRDYLGDGCDEELDKQITLAENEMEEEEILELRKRLVELKEDEQSGN